MSDGFGNPCYVPAAAKSATAAASYSPSPSGQCHDFFFFGAVLGVSLIGGDGRWISRGTGGGLRTITSGRPKRSVVPFGSTRTVSLPSFVVGSGGDGEQPHNTAANAANNHPLLIPEL